MSAKTLVFRAHLDEDTYREVEVFADTSLYGLAESIIDSFGFQFDHCFGFYGDVGAQVVRAREAYELFVDEDGEGINPHAGGVKNTLVSQVFSVDKTMTLLFDYGDEWHFVTTCVEEGVVEAGRKYPFVREGSGDVEQYSHDEHCGCGHSH